MKVLRLNFEDAILPFTPTLKKMMTSPTRSCNTIQVLLVLVTLIKGDARWQIIIILTCHAEMQPSHCTNLCIILLCCFLSIKLHLQTWKLSC